MKIATSTLHGRWRPVALAALLTAAAVTPVLPGGGHVARAASSHFAAIMTGTPTPSVTGTAATSTATSTAVSTASPTATASPRAVVIKPPKPFVHRTNGYQVGAYYFSGWSHAANSNLNFLFTDGPFRAYEPTIGWYDDSQSQVDKHIVQASSAGVTFFAFDWYDVTRSPYAVDKTLNEGLGFYLSSPQRSRMNFCLNFVDQAPFMPRAREWPALVKTWISHLIQPDYVRVNGKPLFIIFSPEHMRDIFGSSVNVRHALDYLRGQARKAHLPGVTIAISATLAAHYNQARIAQLRSEGYDVTTGYNYHATGGEKYRAPVPYKRLVLENSQMWDRISHAWSQPYIPVITSGWDQRFRPGDEQTAIIYAGRTPSQFGCYAAAARHWVDANATRTVKEKIVMVFAWNEFGEGGAIVPTKIYRTGYTDALHRAFTARTAPICAS